MEIPRGMQMAVQALIKMIGLEPQRVMGAMDDIGKSVHNAATRLQNLERQNQAIMAHLGIADPVAQDLEHERTRYNGQINGSGGTA